MSIPAISSGLWEVHIRHFPRFNIRFLAWLLNHLGEAYESDFGADADLL
jgi:hypothetical protein